MKPTGTRGQILVMLVLASAAAGAAGAQPSAGPARLESARVSPSLVQQRPTISGHLTLDRAVSTALRESPMVRGAVEEFNVAVQELRAARAQRRPILSTTAFLSAGSTGNITSTPAPVMPQMTTSLARGTFYDQNLSLMVPLYTGGRLESLVRRAAAARQANSADLAEVKLETALLTRVAYRTAQVRQAFLTVYQDLTRTNEERLRIQRIAYREGRVALYPVLRDETELANATQQLTNTQRDYEVSLVQLKSVMGVNFAPDVTLEGPPPFQPISVLLSSLTGWASPSPTRAGRGSPLSSPAGTAGTDAPARPGAMATGPAVEPPPAGAAGAEPGVDRSTSARLPASTPTTPTSAPGAPDPPAASVPTEQPAPEANAPDASAPQPTTERNTLGPTPTIPVGAPESGSALSPLGASSLELDRLLAMAEQRRPLLEAYRLRLQAARQGIGVARSAYRPQVSLFAMGDAMQGRSIDPLRGYTAGVAIGLPILDGGLRRAEVRGAQAEQRRQEQELQRAVLQVTQEVTENWLALRAAERNVATAQAGVRSGEEDFRIAQIRYQEGKSINVEALDALYARTRARVNLAQAIFDYQVAADQLRRSLGLDVVDTGAARGS